MLTPGGERVSLLSEGVEVSQVLERKMEQEIDRWIGKGLAEMQTYKCSVVMKRELSPEGEAFNLPVNVCPNPHLWS